MGGAAGGCWGLGGCAGGASGRAGREAFLPGRDVLAIRGPVEKVLA